MKIHDKIPFASCFTKLRAALAVVLFFMSAGSGNLVQAQQTGDRTFTGTVLDENNQPMPGVAVLVEGTTNGTMTDPDGTFTLTKIPDGAAVIVSCIGYKDQRLEGTKTTWSIKLIPDTQTLDEVVLVAFGQQKKVSVTGSIATVAPTELRKTTATRLDNALAGRVTGLTSMQSSGGQPGADGATMYLRGGATTNGKNPLILVDGVERDNIRTIDMNEVESLSVLKDASATALYGVQGANGVILIQTRKGQKGKAQLSISFDQSFTSFTKEPSRLHSWDYMRLRNEALGNDGQPAKYSDEVIQKYKEPLAGLDPNAADYATQKKMRNYMYCDNDYYRKYIRKNTPQQRINANVSGGTDHVNYFLNFGYIHQGGNLNTEDSDYLGYNPQCYMDRLSLRSNLDFHITNSLTATLNIASYAEKVNMPAGQDSYTGGTSDMIGDLIYECVTILPISPGPTTISEFGVDDGYLIHYNYLDRSAFEIINRRGFHTDRKKNLNTQFSMNWDLSKLVTKGLSVSGMVAYDTYNSLYLEGFKSEKSYSINLDYDHDTLSYALYNGDESPLSFSQKRYSNYQVYAQASVNYNRTFGKHSVTAMANGYRKYWVTTSAEIPYNVIGTAARATYSYDDRYLAEANLGYNGSEQFAPGNRFGFFPSGSIGWIASNESFLSGNSVLTWLKFRGSYGLVGNDSISSERFLYQDDIQVEAPADAEREVLMAKGLGGHFISEGLLGNKNLKWELAKKFDVGAEFGFFQDFRITLDYFREHRNQILIARQTTPAVQGVLSDYIPKVNMGIVNNHGYEAEVSYGKSISSDLSFNIKGNFSFNDNKIVEFDEPERTEDYAYRYHQEGFRLGQQFGYKIDWNSTGKGYFTSQDEIDNYYPYSFGKPRVGDFVYKDENGDKKIDDKDMIPIGFSTSIPGVSYGITLSVNYKGFDFNILFSGLGRYSHYYSGNGVFEYTKAGTYYEWQRNAWTLERWQNGDKITYPALSTAVSTSTSVVNDFFLQNRSFLRLKNVELGYTLPLKALKRIGVDSFRIYLAGQNLFVWDNLRITHIDPEQNSAIGYPVTKNVSLGFNVNF